MALVYDNTAEGLIQRFRDNNADNDKWTIDRQGWGSMLGWTPSQGREVADAAEQNESIRFLDILVLNQMTDEAVDVFAIIVGRFHRLNRIKIDQEVEGAPTMGILDKLFAALAACPSDVERLDCLSCITPRGFHALVESFPNIETLEVWVPRHVPQECEACAVAADGFALAFANAAARGLSSLRTVFIAATEPSPHLSTLLTALHMSSSVATVDIDFPGEDVDMVRAARSFCTLTKSVQDFVVRGNEGLLGTTSITAFFDIGPIPSFSPAVTRMEFFACDFSHEDTENVVKNAVQALQNLQSLRFGRCRFPYAMKVVQSLPRLSMLSCLSRDVVDNPFATLAEGPYDSMPYMLITNQDLEELCRAVERPDSLLDDIELDLVSSNGESFPAIARLMGACKRRLVLNFGEHSWRVAAHVVGGSRRLRHDLTDLRMRFMNCELEDPNYADIVRSFIPNKTLTQLEIGFDPNALLDTTELSSAAILSLVESNKTLRSLSLLGLELNCATEILEGIMPILASTNRSLRVLELYGSDLEDCLPRARALALDVLKKNDVLSTLEGFDIPEGDPVDSLLLLNQYGRIFLRPNDPTPIGIWATVLARVSHDQQIGVMYKFLRAKPGLIRLPPVASASARGSSAGRKRGRGQEE